jgi:hypothetical protein
MHAAWSIKSSIAAGYTDGGSCAPNGGFCPKLAAEKSQFHRSTLDYIPGHQRGEIPL